MNKLLRPLLRFRKHQPDVDALSEYIDGRLDGARADAIESHLSICTVCRDAHRGLFETRALLAAMPEVSHPRSFRLRQADVDAPARVPARRGGSAAMRWAPACAAVSAVVFVAVFSADLVSRDANNSAQFSSLESNEPIGMTAADDSADGDAMAPAPSTAARESAPAPGGQGEGADGGTPVVAESQAGATNPQDAAAPTGQPPSGDAPVEGATGASPDADATAAALAGGTNFIPPTETPAALGAVPPDAAPPVTQVDADVEQFSDDGSNDGNRNAFLVVEITAAAIALLAGAAYVAWRWMQRGNAA